VIWATRPRCHVDRTACAWLIRRFIDPEPTFVFVEEAEELPPGAIGFDMRGVDLGHRDGGCSFESFLDRYELRDQRLEDIARIVHEADIADGAFHAPEAAGLEAIISGLARLSGGDEELLVRAMAVFDALFANVGGAAPTVAV
jgi:hypothetical protein